MTDLDARYGRTRRSSRRTRTIAIAVAAAFVVVFAAWVLWAGILSPTAEVGVDGIGYTVESDSVTTVTYQVTVDPGTAIACSVQALDGDFATVGWLVIDIPAADTHTRQFSTTVRTVHRAVTGLINRCWAA